MHPQRLMLQAFGPYAHKQVIDFRELKESTFLLIHGPTGSGKTSILDGITFALYGDTSTRERQARQMRSDHAPPSLTTEVEFDFCLGKDYYRIKRNPEQPRPKKRGEGFTTRDPSATLWSRSASANDKEEGVVVASGYSEVTSKVEEILGFRSDQFRQVVVLPQGQFRDFLLAGSQKREEILEILFKTGTYRFIQESLKEEGKKIHTKWETVLSRKNVLLGDSTAKSLEELEELFNTIKIRITTLEKEILEARRESAVAGENVKNGEQVLEKIKEKEEAENLLKDLEGQKHIFQEKAGLLDKARKALPLKEVEKALVQRQKESLAAQKRYSELSSALAKARKEELSAQKRMKDLEKEQPRIEELVKEIARIEQLREKLFLLKTAIAELEGSEKEAGKTEAEDKRLKKNLDECETEKEKKGELLKQKQEQANQLTILEQSCEYALEQYTIRLELDICKNDYILAAEEVEQAKSKFEEIDRDVKQGKIELDILENQRKQGQAAILASQLHEGKACPVCGSLTHPSPAISDVQLPSEKAVEEKKNEVLNREQTRQSCYERLNKKIQAISALETKQRMFTKQLKDAATVHTDILKETLARKRKALQQAKTAAGEIDRIEQELLTIRDREKKLKSL
ncbi:MAG: AAA family ATPase, partial [Candidatus Pacearchaeota archaeon]|nr:AAA family ATPase [Candidatus Pacearchaeota archaeon]